jgi:thiol-disulfide isomerase/thioredoxin
MVADWELYLVSGIITLIILFAGIFFGLFIGKEKVDVIQSGIDDLRIRQDDATLSFSLMSTFGNKSCDIIQHELSDTMVAASDLGKKITDYEKEKIKDSVYQSTKEDYTLIQIRYWSYLERLKKECNTTDFITILYFYSTDCQDCNKQGLIYDYLKGEYPQNVMIFALDSNVDLNTLKILKEVYGVERIPTSVINDEKYEGLVELEQVKGILCTGINICS